MKAQLDLATFGKEFRKARGRRGYSMRAVAKETGLDKSAIFRAEHDEMVDATAFVALCHWLDVDARRFLA